MTTETKITVRYAETDQMGIAHHSNYFVWFEVARTEFIKISGINYQEIETQGVLLPLIKAECEYKFPAKYADDLIIKISVSQYTKVRISFDYQIIKPKDNQIIAIGQTQHAFVDRNLKPLNLQKRHPKIWDKIELLAK